MYRFNVVAFSLWPNRPLIVTDVLDRSGGDVRRARAWSRHWQVQTVMLYDDNRSDFGGDMADLIALPEV